MAAEGNVELVGKSEVYGWSPAYEAVAALKAEVERLKELNARMVCAAQELKIESLREVGVEAYIDGKVYRVPPERLDGVFENLCKRMESFTEPLGFVKAMQEHHALKAKADALADVLETLDCKDEPDIAAALAAYRGEA